MVPLPSDKKKASRSPQSQSHSSWTGAVVDRTISPQSRPTTTGITSALPGFELEPSITDTGRRHRSNPEPPPEQLTAPGCIADIGTRASVGYGRRNRAAIRWPGPGYGRRPRLGRSQSRRNRWRPGLLRSHTRRLGQSFCRCQNPPYAYLVLRSEIASNRFICLCPQTVHNRLAIPTRPGRLARYDAYRR